MSIRLKKLQKAVIASNNVAHLIKASPFNHLVYETNVVCQAKEQQLAHERQGRHLNSTGGTKANLRGNLAKARFSVKGGYIHTYTYKKMLMALTLYVYVN